MSFPLNLLPAELLLHVLTFVPHADLITLSLVSHHFQKLIEPVLWNKIELHRFQFHEDYAHRSLCEEEAALNRPYHRTGREPSGDENSWSWDVDEKDRLERAANEKAILFLTQFHEKKIIDRTRSEHLAGLVRWLCLPFFAPQGVPDLHSLGSKINIWNVIPIFKNLEYLELSAFWVEPKFVAPFEVPQHPPPKLHTLKLRGYIPAGFVQYLCQSAETIKELQLGILDVPIGSSMYNPRPNPPPPVPEDEDEDETEDLDHDQVAPRPLACLTPSILSNFTSLTKLYLYRPSESADPGSTTLSEQYISVRSDIKILNEWASLLRATRKTLKELTLEQKPVGDENEPDVTGNQTFMVSFCHERGYVRFVKIVLPVLLEKAEWPALQSIRLFGFESYGVKPDPSYPIREGVDLMKQLKGRFPSVDVKSELGRRMLFTEQTGEVESGGDVLDCANGLSEDEDNEDDD
jgi:hypothetical protein